MRLRIALIFGLVAALAVGAVSLTQAASAFKVTGGGQTDVGNTGAGDTIAFTAQNTGQGDAARGQVQFVDREGGTGRDQVVYHGVVTCLQAASGGKQGAAYIAGDWTNQGAGTFEIYVADNGEGSGTQDMIFIDQDDPNPSNCSDDDTTKDEPVALGRGNVQVHQ